MATVVNQDQVWLSSIALRQEVIRLVEEERSGTLFVRTRDEHWGCFVFEKGAIVSLMCRGVRGSKSFKYLRDIDSCTFRFDAEAMLGNDGARLPGTRTIIAEVWKQFSLDGQYTGDNQNIGDSQNIGADPYAQTATGLKQVILGVAVDLLGPVGEIVCEEKFTNYGVVSGMEDVSELAARIALEFSNLEEANEFQRRVMKAAGAGANVEGGAETAESPYAPYAPYGTNLDYSNFRSVLESEAAEIVGPVALELCAECFDKFAANRHIADASPIIDSLADSIGDAGLAEQFRARVASRLKSGQT